MSRAFTKDRDDVPIPSVPDRPVSNERNPVTETGASKIAGEIASLKDRLARASDGEDRSMLNRDLPYCEARKAGIQIVPMPQDVDHVQFGTMVVVERDGTRQDIGALRLAGMTAPFVYVGARTGNVFHSYVEQLLVSSLAHGDIVIIDNLPAHKAAGVRYAIEAAAESLL